MGKIITIGGSPVRGPYGEAFQDRVSGVPNLKLGATLTLRAPDDGGNQRYGEITIPDALPSTITAAKLVWLGENDQGDPASFQWHFPDDLLTSAKAAGGTFRLPDEADLFGSLASVQGVRLVLRNASGWGNVRDLDGFEEEDTGVTPFVKTGDPVLSGTHTEGAAVVIATPLAWTGEPGVVISYDEYQTSEDTSGTNAGAAFAATGVVPSIVSGQDAYRVAAYAEGPGVPGGRAGPYWSNWIGITAGAVTPDVTVSRAPLVATKRINVDGRTGALPSPAGLLSGGGATATIVSFVAETGDLYTGPITGGTISDNTPLTWTGSLGSGGGNANGAPADWSYKAGESYHILAPAFTGTPTFVSAPILSHATDSSHADAKEIDLVGVFPKWLGKRYFEAAWEYTGKGVSGTGRTATAWLPIASPTLDAIPDEDWFPVVEAEPGGGRRLTGIYLHESHIVDDLRWTTSTDARLETVQFPTDREPTTANGATTIKDGRTFVLRDCAPAVHGSKDYAVFVSPADDSRDDLLRITCLIGGAWTPLSAPQTVPEVDIPPATTTLHEERVILHPQEMIEDGTQGGTCMQFPRGKDADGETIVMGNDIGGGAVVSDDEAENWYIDKNDGLFMSQSCTGIRIDGKYVHAQWGALFMKALGNHDDKAGTYRKDRTTGRWTLTDPLPLINGSNSGWARRNLRYVAYAAGSGSGPDTRHVYALHVQATGNIPVRRSTNGGASYSAFGAALNRNTFGNPFELWADTTALYINTSEGVWRRPVGTDTWTKATGLPAGNVFHLEKHGSTVYVCVEGGGFYKAADATTLAFTQVYAGNIVYFGICPTNTNKRVLIPNGIVAGSRAHRWTTQGDTGWQVGNSTEYPGQHNDFAHHMYGNSSVWVHWHPTDENIVYAMRFAHPGKSEDGGKTFRFASKNLDYSEARDIATSPSRPEIMLFGVTDRLGVYYSAPHYAMDNLQANKDAMKDDVKAVLGLSSGAPLTCAGTLILERGDYRRFIAQVGEHTAAKTLVRFEKTTATARTDQAATGNGSISITSTHNIPGGIYRFACTTAGGTGTGKFRGTGPMDLDMGEWTVGTQRTWNHPWGGSITATFNDGNVDWNTGAVITYTANPIGDYTIMDQGAAGRSSAQYGQTNPLIPYRGCTGRYVLSMDTSGVVSVVRTIPYMFASYIGTDGAIIAPSGSGTIMRCVDEGNGTWTTFASNLGSFSGLSFPCIIGSPTDAQRAYAGLNNGCVTRIQNGVKTTIFDWDAWLTARSITTGCPGTAQRNGRWCPPVTGVVESPHDENLVTVGLYCFGEPYTLFRTENAQAASPTWECITFNADGEGFSGPIQRMRQNRHTSEALLCSSLGTIWVDQPAGWRAANGVTRSMIADLRATPGYATFTKKI